MPYLVTCPNCASKLKSPNPVAAGKSVACPQCKTTFKLSEPAPEIDAPAAAPARPAPASTPAPRTSRSDRPAPARREDDEDERPRSRRRDDDEDRPRRRRDEDEEDERPRGRRRPADEDDEEERPKSRRRRDEDEDEEEERPRSRRRPADTDEDERPRGRRSRDEDEDEETDRRKSRKARAAADEDEEEADDDRPRRRGRGRGKKKSKKGLVLILGALAALLLLGIGGVGFMYFVWDPLGLFGGGGASSDMLAWMPSDTQQVEGIDVASVSKNTKALAAIRSDLKDAEAIGIKAEDMSSVMQGKKGGKGAAAEVTVIKLKSSADKEKISKAAGGTEATASGKKYFKTKNGGGLFFPSDKIVVLTKSEATLTGLLQKDDGKVVINEELKSTVKRADGDMWAAAVGAAANTFGDAGGAGGPKGGGGFPGMGAPPAPKNSLATAKLSGDDVNMKIEITFADADSAKKAADQIDTMMKFVKGMMEGMDQMVGKMGGGGNPAAAKMQGAKKMFETLKVTTSGSVVTITMTAPIDSMEGFGKGGFGM